MRQILLAFLVVSMPAATHAQDAAARPATHAQVECWAGGVWSAGTTGGLLESAYTVPLVNGTGQSSATQALTLDSGGAPGFEAGVQIFFTPHLGLQVGGGRSWSSLSGRNKPYRLAIHYVSRQPPNYVPVAYDFARDVEWPDTEGTRTITTVIAGPVWRWEHPSSSVGGTMAGGLSLQRYGGTVRGLAYTEFRLGGHSTLFYSQHRVEVEPAPGDWFFGPYLSGDVRVRLADRARLTGGVRVHLGSATLPLRTRAVRLIDPDEDTFPPDLATVSAALEPQATMTVPAVRWQVFAGLVFELR